MQCEINFTKSRWVTVNQLAALPQYRDAFTAAAIRHLIFNADDKLSSSGETLKGNGLSEAGAIARLGRKVLIDVERFDEWLGSHRARN